MKRLGVWLPRWNHLKTLLPVMEEARARGIQVTAVCGSSAGKPELSAAPRLAAFREAWPWATWIYDAHGYNWAVDVVVAHGVVHDAEMIRRTEVPWVAVDHLHENAWWYLTGHPELWEPWHRVCLSGSEGEYLLHADHDKPPDDSLPWATRFLRTGYTALDGPHDTPAEIRKAYGLPDRYLLVGTAVQASTIPWDLWQSYFASQRMLWPLAKMKSGYRGPTYGWILRVLHDYARATGMALVGKGRWKHETHRIHSLFDHYFDDEPTDPGRALRLMQGAAMYAGGISGLAVEALAAGTPTINWTYYPPLLADHMGFRKLRQKLWIDGIWQTPGIGKMFRVYDPEEWAKMFDLLNTTGPGIYHHVPSSYATRVKVVGSGGASAKVLEACGL